MKEIIYADLVSLWNQNEIERAKQLNEALGENRFHTNNIPMHFTGNAKARTVMVMLNPGGYDPNYDFAKSGKNDQTLNDFIEKYIYSNTNYGEIDKVRSDNFDVKQAAFLYDFDDPELQIPRDFWALHELKLLAKRNILMNKFQLEFIPFVSRGFVGVLDTVAQAQKNFQAFEPYLFCILDEIFSEDRKYVVFCSKQFYNLFAAASVNRTWSNTFTLYASKGFREGKLTLNCSKVEIQYKGKQCSAIIAHSFASRALPNAYEKMAKYGKFCHDFFCNN